MTERDVKKVAAYVAALLVREKLAPYPFTDSEKLVIIKVCTDDFKEYLKEIHTEVEPEETHVYNSTAN